MHDGLALVSTDQVVSVVDIKDEHSIQALGDIAFPGVEKLAVASPGSWAGYANSMGWRILPLPRLLSHGEATLLNETLRTSSSADEANHYRLHLYSDRGVKTVSMLIPFSGNLTKRPAEGGLLVR